MNSSTTLFMYALCFGIFFMHTWIGKSNKSNRLFDSHGRPAADPVSLLGLYAAGIIWLALIPALFIARSFEDPFFTGIAPSVGWIIVFTLLLAAAVISGARLNREIGSCPKGCDIFSKRILSWFFVLRIVFLCAYELFFRGFVLFDCIEWLGIPWAVTISTLLTVIIHVFNGKKEMWACIPFGIILCCCCITIHTVWPAIILHVALAMTYETLFIQQLFTKLKTAK